MKNLNFFESRFSRRWGRNALAAAGMAALVTCAQADNLVANGSFEQLLMPNVSSQLGNGPNYAPQQLTDWTATGYNYVFTPGTADTTGAVGFYGKLYLWGPGNGSTNGLTSSPDGGNFVAMDGAFDQGPISQTIHGLTPGQATTVSFYYAGAQQQGYNGATTEAFQVSLGSVSQKTPVLSNSSHGFTGWTSETMTFVPTSSSEVLSFLAIGTPGGVPPFSLLDGVSVSGSPEPATWALLGAGLAGFGALVRLRRKSARSEKA